MFLVLFVNILFTQEFPFLNSTHGNKLLTVTVPTRSHTASILGSKRFG